MVEMKPIDQSARELAIRILTENWGSPFIVSRGRVHDGRTLPGFITDEGHEIRGLITYDIAGVDCEIVSLNSLTENRGIGSALVGRVREEAVQRGCGRLWLVTTNDNTQAIRFYQKRGFALTFIHLNAIREARRLKPEIPLFGCDGIPILHEIEFEMLLQQKPCAK